MEMEVQNTDDNLNAKTLKTEMLGTICQWLLSVYIYSKNHS